MNSTNARVLVAGGAQGEILLLDEPLSFWGGFDPGNGEIIDVHHPQAGQRVGGKILVMPSSRGSAGTPACIAETLRNGSGPLAFILGSADVNISVGVSVANRLYGLSIPVLEITFASIAEFKNKARMQIHDDGIIEMLE